MTLAILAWLALFNVAAFLTFRLDKRRAERGEWRIPETRLLALALAGGWPGAKLAQRRFRHKTRKQPFRTLLNLVPFAWLGVVWLMLLGPATLQAFRALPGPVASSAYSMPTRSTSAGSDDHRSRHLFQRARKN